MTTDKKISVLITALGYKNLPQKLQHYLPTPNYLKHIITLTNQGRTQEALETIEISETILQILNSELDNDMKQWFSETLDKIRIAVLSSYD